MCMEVKSWSQLVDAILLRKVAFITTFFVVFILSYSLLAWLDFLPELVQKEDLVEKNAELNTDHTNEFIVGEPAPVVVIPAATMTEPVEPVLPLTMTIAALNRTIGVLNPTSREVVDLDAALLEGVVRHPDSATLEQNGTVFLLGHSSYLPAVRNKNFQAFNGIQNLKWGDEITITAAEGEYVYRVEKVYRAKAQDVTVPIAGTTKRLYLATCNSFGTTDDRYIVEAELLEVRLF